MSERQKISIDRKRVKTAFADYVANYDTEDDKIRLKIDHTYRVADISELLAEAMGLDAYDTDLAWLIGMLHDIGRFEQLRRFDTFVTADSIDHAHFGVELLFDEGLIRNFVKLEEASEIASLMPSDLLVLKKAIWNHGAFRMEEGLSERELLFAKLIRDADKIDILKVANDVPLETIYNVTTEQLHGSPVSEGVMEQFRKEQTILRTVKQVPVDHLVGHIALVFELEFSESYALIEKQGYLAKLLAFESPNKQIQEQFLELRRRMKDFLGRKVSN